MRSFLKILTILFVYLTFCTHSGYAIDWISLKSSTGNSVELDKDSIKEIDNHYFYNIKVVTKYQEEIVVTIQSSVAHSYSARINYYTPDEYQSLNGDYENIAKNATKNLEPTTFESRVGACYREVQRIMSRKTKPQITF